MHPPHTPSQWLPTQPQLQSPNPRYHRTSRTPQALLLMLILLGISFQTHAQTPTIPPETLQQKAQRYIRAYPNFIQEFRNGKLIWKQGPSMQFDDGQPKEFKDKLNTPDLEDQVSLRYPTGPDSFGPPARFADPGRFRVTEMFKRMYGSSKKQVRRKLTRVIWMPNFVNRRLLVNRVNGIDKHMRTISNELEKLVRTSPKHRRKYLKFLTKVGGTFNWRYIRGTKRLSCHSFGISLDINVKHSHYWRWSKEFRKKKPLKYGNKIPKKIVEIFEKNGFIWGGKWYHYDTMHFEYRPELLIHPSQLQPATKPSKQAQPRPTPPSNTRPTSPQTTPHPNDPTSKPTPRQQPPSKPTDPESPE